MWQELYVTAGLLAALATGAPATAEDQLPLSEVREAQISQVQSRFGGKALDQEVLDTQRGGTDTKVINDMKLNGVVSDNTASQLNTGNNSITEGAFAGVSGVPMIVQNSGNNVLIQNATILNVQVQ